MPSIDLVDWRPGSAPVFAHRHPETNLSTLTQLIVAESQEAVLFGKGRLVGKFGPGKHTLNTENLPLLRNFFGLPFGGKNPFTAEVWYVNKLLPLNIDWQTDGMMHHDPDYQTMVPMVAKGRYGLRVDDAERFLVKLVGTAEEFTAAQLTAHFSGQLVAATKTLLLQYMLAQRIGIRTVSACLIPLSQALQAAMTSFWDDYGFSLISFYVTAVDVDNQSPAGQRILDAMSRQSAQVIGGYSWQQSQAFEAANHAIESQGSGGGLLGALMMSSVLGSAAGSLHQPVSAAFPGTHTPFASGTQVAAQSPRMVFCSNCSKKYSSTEKYCPSCGDPYTPCTRCGADNDARSYRCVSCGLPLSANSAVLAPACSRCGCQLDPSAAFCPKCGQKA